MQEGHSRDSLQEVNMMMPKIQPDRPKSTSKKNILVKSNPDNNNNNA